MKEKNDFKSITEKIKKECLNFGIGMIHFDKDLDDLWIDEYENSLGTCVHVDAISVDNNEITLYEDKSAILFFSHINSIDRQIQVYESIYNHQEQLQKKKIMKETILVHIH